MNILIVIGALVVGFITGVLVGRRNSKKVELSVDKVHEVLAEIKSKLK